MLLVTDWAGMAAALAAKQGISPRQLDVIKLQTRLAKMGAYLPNLRSIEA